MLINEKKREFEAMQRLVDLATMVEQPELVQAHRKILLEECVDGRLSNLERPGEYDVHKEMDPWLVLVCSDCMVLLRVLSTADERYAYLGCVGWGLDDGATLQDKVSEELFSVAHLSTKRLYTIRAPGERREALLQRVRITMAGFREQARFVQQTEEDMRKHLTGLHFAVTGTVPVSPPGEKPFTVYIISMANERGKHTILKRYRQFAALHDRLVQLYGADVALPKVPHEWVRLSFHHSIALQLPSRKIVRSTKGSVVTKRERLLEAYLNQMVKLRDALQQNEVRQFLTTTVSGKNEDELLPAFAPPPSVLAAIEAVATTAPAEAPRITESPCIATHAYNGEEPGSLVLERGQSLLVLSRSTESPDWCYCRREADGVEGWCPSTYISDDALFSRPRAREAGATALPEWRARGSNDSGRLMPEFRLQRSMTSHNKRTSVIIQMVPDSDDEISGDVEEEGSAEEADDAAK